MKIYYDKITNLIKTETEGVLTYLKCYEGVDIKFNGETLIEIETGGYIHNLSKDPPQEEIIIKQIYTFSYIFSDSIRYKIQINYDSVINWTYSFNFNENLKELVLDDYE